MKARMLFATGYEEVEALTVVDILRRAGIECAMVAADDSEAVTGAHGICVSMDEKLSEISGECDIVILPGGIPGVPNLKANPKVEALVKKQNDRGAYVAAICAVHLQLSEHLVCLQIRKLHAILDARDSSWQRHTAQILWLWTAMS